MKSEMWKGPNNKQEMTDEDLHIPALVNKKIRGLQITMNDRWAAVMKIIHSSCLFMGKKIENGW